MNLTKPDELKETEDPANSGTPLPNKVPASQPAIDPLDAPPSGENSKHELVANSADALFIDSRRLFQGHREVWIQHGDQMYRLRLTASDKLYLSK